MAIRIETKKSFVTPNRSSTFKHMREILSPVQDAIKLVNERPILSGGAFLTVSTFLVSLISRSATTAILPFLGIPGIALLGYGIFFNSKPLDKPIQDSSIIKEKNL